MEWTSAECCSRSLSLGRGSLRCSWWARGHVGTACGGVLRLAAQPFDTLIIVRFLEQGVHHNQSLHDYEPKPFWGARYSIGLIIFSAIAADACLYASWSWSACWWNFSPARWRTRLRHIGSSAGAEARKTAVNDEASGYGLWLLVLLNSAIFIMFAFSFFKPQTGRDWRIFGVFSAFIIALFVELYGFPLTILGAPHIASYGFFGVGFYLFSSAWNVLYYAQGHYVLAKSGRYTRIRHPQYVGLVLQLRSTSPRSVRCKATAHAGSM